MIIHPERKEKHMFKPGDIVRYSPKFCGPGEEKYFHLVTEVNEETGHILIVTLDTDLPLGSSERVTADMIERVASVST